MNAIVAVEGFGRRETSLVRAACSPGSRDIDEAQILSRMAVPLIVLTRDLRCASANPAMASLCGWPTRAMIGRSVAELVPRAATAAMRAFELLDTGAEVPEYEICWDGNRYLLSVSALRPTAGEVEGIIVTATDVTRRFRTEERLRRSRRRLADYARHDHLTGLLNRRGFEARLRRHLSIAQREVRPLSALIADIDWFKTYNDQLGHLAGDACLRRVAGELQRSVHRAGGEIARYGGEEFVAILPDTDIAQARRVADSIRSAVLALAIEHPLSVHGWVTVSLGVAALDGSRPFLTYDETQERLLGGADEALYLAKVSGRNQVRVFSAASQG